MNKVTFQAYARPFDSGAYGMTPGVTLSHTFVVSSDNHDWNCWGDGRGCLGSPDVITLPEGMGSAYSKWASYIYGQGEGQRNDGARSLVVAGLHERYDGVCHNAANRILVLAGPGVNVWQAPINAVVILMYGKYGFNISQYIQSVREAAAKVNAEEPGSITQAEVDAVVASISGGATDEANILDNDILRSHFNDHLSVQGLSADQLEKLMQIYVQFQNERQAKFADAESWSPQPPDFQVRYGVSMKPVLIDCLGQMKNVLGESTYSAIFAALPEQAAGFLLQG